MRIAVLLLNYCCPDAPRAVYPFLYSLFNDPAILPVPALLRPWLAARIATQRWPEVADNYRRIGGSPMRRIIEQQCRALQEVLQDLGEVRYVAALHHGPGGAGTHEVSTKLLTWRCFHHPETIRECYTADRLTSAEYQDAAGAIR
jgi:protoheme ferro-lyase